MDNNNNNKVSDFKPLGLLDLKVRNGTHILQIYKDKEELEEAVVAFCESGLNIGDNCFIVCNKYLNRATIEEFLKKKGFNPDELTTQKKLTFCDYKDFYFSANELDFKKAIDKIAALINKDTPDYRGMTDDDWVEKNSWRLFLEYEAELTKFLSERKKGIIICAYPANKLSFEDMIEIINAHMMILYKKDGGWALSETIERLIFNHEIDSLKKIDQMFVGREIKMIELKKRVEELEKELERRDNGSK